MSSLGEVSQSREHDHADENNSCYIDEANDKGIAVTNKFLGQKDTRYLALFTGGSCFVLDCMLL